MSLTARCSNPQSKVYSVPVGGMNVVGEWGYIEAFREMMEQVSVYKHWLEGVEAGIVASYAEWIT